MKKFLAAFILVSLAFYSQAQEETQTRHDVRKFPKVKTSQKKKLAESLVKSGSYYNAVEYYEDILKDKPGDLNIIHNLAQLNMGLRDYEQAEKYFKLELSKDAKKWPNDQFYYGQMLKMNGKYDEAKKAFQDYNKMSLDKDEKSYKSLSKVEIEGCDSSIAWLSNPGKIRVDHEDGSINNVLTDFAPKPMKNGGLMYSSLKSDTAISLAVNAKHDYYSKIFTAERKGKEWINDTKMPYPPNDSKNHVGNAIMSDDEKTLIYTKCDGSEIIRMKCKLFKSEKNGSEWANGTELKELNSESGTTTQPAFGQDKDGKPILFFVSDRGGKGGEDIFYADMLPDGKFGAVKNAGSEVNSAGDDKSPFYDTKTKTLYFSSTGRPGLGGMDVYKVSGAPDNWGTPYNLGAPVNSSYDDFYFVLDGTGKKGYMVSNRPGTKTIRGKTCCDDIWSVSIKEDVVLKGTFALRTDPNQRPVEGVDVSMYRVVDKTFEFMSNTLSTKEPFTFTLKRGQAYKINGNKEGHWPTVENIAIKEDEERDTIMQVFLIDPIIKKVVKIENVYFAFDKSNVLDIYKQKMDSVYSVMMQNPGYSVEVQGHTDSKGSDEYNNKLSQKRADEAKAYLVSKGLPKDRVIAKGYGESAPLKVEKQGEDDPEARWYNRRVVFKIITDKPESAPEIQYDAQEPVQDTKTGPGFEKK